MRRNAEMVSKKPPDLIKEAAKVGLAGTGGCKQLADVPRQGALLAQDCAAVYSLRIPGAVLCHWFQSQSPHLHDNHHADSASTATRGYEIRISRSRSCSPSLTESAIRCANCTAHKQLPRNRLQHITSGSSRRSFPDQGVKVSRTDLQGAMLPSGAVTISTNR